MTGTARRCSWPLSGGSVPAWLVPLPPVQSPAHPHPHESMCSRPFLSVAGVGHSEARGRGGAAGVQPCSVSAHPQAGGCLRGYAVPLPAGEMGFLGGSSLRLRLTCVVSERDFFFF